MIFCLSDGKIKTKLNRYLEYWNENLIPKEYLKRTSANPLQNYNNNIGYQVVRVTFDNFIQITFMMMT